MCGLWKPTAKKNGRVSAPLSRCAANLVNVALAQDASAVSAFSPGVMADDMLLFSFDRDLPTDVNFPPDGHVSPVPSYGNADDDHEKATSLFPEACA